MEKAKSSGSCGRAAARHHQFITLARNGFPHAEREDYTSCTVLAATHSCALVYGRTIGHSFPEQFMRSLLILSILVLAITPLIADEDSPKPKSKLDRKSLDRYTIPADADVEGLLKYMRDLSAFEPTTPEEALLHHRKARIAILDAANKILKVETDKRSEAYVLAKTIQLGADLRGLIVATSQERRDYVAEVVKLLKSNQPGKQQLNLALKTSDLLESVDPAVAIESYEAFGPVLAASKNKELAENGRMMAGAARRLALPGKVLKLNAKTVDGEDFDLASLKGKVVLLDFWATWCAPCLAEMPNMRKLHAQHKAKGFEIVGLSVDDDRPALEEFLEAKKLPWIILHDAENDGEHPILSEYGIMTYPTMILIGRDGKVLDVTARGDNLAELLEKQFEQKP